MSGLTAVELPGTMSLTKTTLTAASAANVQAAAPTSDLSLNYEKTNRISYDATVSNINYYIQVDADINELIFYKNRNETGGGTNAVTDSSGDDIWGMYGLTIASTDSPAPTNVVKNLPTFSNKDVLVKNVSLYAVDDGSHNNFSYNKLLNGSYTGAVDVTSTGRFFENAFNITMKLGSNTNGIINSVSTLYYNHSTFNELRFSAVEELRFAQIIGFDYDTAYSYTNPTAETRDTLYFDISDSMLNSNATLSTKLTAVTNIYKDTDILTGWSIAFTAISASDTSVIAKHARSKSWNVNNNGTYFANGDKIVTDTAYSLTLTINDGLNQSVTLLSNQPVYGVFNHNSSLDHSNKSAPSPLYIT